MKLNYKKIYDAFINKYHIFGIESYFHDCNLNSGPTVPAWLAGQTIYEIYIRSFSPEGTFNGVQKNLVRLKSYGIDVIWFMPIFPIGKVDRKGKRGCPYSVRDYFNVNPEYGTNEDFKNLIDKAHGLGMRVVLDLVVNHVAHDYSGFRTLPGIALRDKEGSPTRKIADWSDVVDLDYDTRETWNHVLKIMQFWIEQYDIDGYRCDVAGLVPTEFWEWAVPQIQLIKNDVFMLAEWESPLLQKKAFHSTYDWIFYSIMMDVINQKAPARDLADWIEIKKNIYPQNSQFLRFLENHDKLRAANLFNEDQLPALLTLIFSIDGIPLIYNGQEIGDKHCPSLFEKDSINWENRNLKIHKTIMDLVLLRKNHMALCTKNYQFIRQPNKKEILVYRKSQDESLLIIINFNKAMLDISDINELNQSINSEILFNTHPDFDPASLKPYQAVIVLEKLK